MVYYCLIQNLNEMKTKFLFFALSLLFAMPYVLHAEEIEIPLEEVIGITPLSGENPLDDPIQSPGVPTRPTDFRATINGHSLFILRLNSNIPSAHATVINTATGNIVVNQQFTTSLQSQISTSGLYVLRIQTATGAIFGNFVVQ